MLRADVRAESAMAFLRDMAVLLLLIAGGVWALLTYFEPCDAATLCALSATPLVRPPRAPSKAPRWWQRLRLRLRLRQLDSRRRTADSDIAWLQRELAIVRNQLDAVHAERDQIADDSAWARSDLAKLQ